MITIVKIIKDKTIRLHKKRFYFHKSFIFLDNLKSITQAFSFWSFTIIPTIPFLIKIPFLF